MCDCNSIDCSPPGSSVHGIRQVRILEWVSHSILQGTFPTQGSNAGLLQCRQILYHLSYQGRPIYISASQNEIHRYNCNKMCIRSLRETTTILVNKVKEKLKKNFLKDIPHSQTVILNTVKISVPP